MTANPSKDYASDLELLRSSAVGAGIIAAGYFRREIKTWTKDNSSPVTEADFLVDQFLSQTLCAARPDYGWLSEETADDLVRLEKSRVFIVDPIDGTRAFLKGDDCWTISLAVVEDGIPVAGVVYAPARDELYEACLGGGAFLNKMAFNKREQAAGKPVIPGPDAVHKELQSAGLEYIRGPGFPSLAYRLVQVATGVIDVAVARRGAQDWDIAGAAVILNECGIALDDVCSPDLMFNKPEIRHSALAALSDISLRSSVHDALRRVYGCPTEEAIDDNKPEQQSK